MGILFMDGFEEYSTADDLYEVWTISTSLPSPSTTTYRTGSRSVYLASYTDQLGLNLKSMGFTPPYYVGFAAYFSTLASSYHDLFFISDNSTASNPHLGIVKSSSGTLYLRDSSETTVDTASNILPEAAWCYIEVYLSDLANSANAEVRLNGSTILTATAEDFMYLAGTGRYLVFGNSLDAAYIDDFYLADDAFYGPLRVKYFYPDADGTHTDFTRNTGSNDWETLDETPDPDDDTTYVEGDATGEKQTVGITTSGITGNIRAVAVRNWVKGEGDGPTKVKTLVRSNSTDYEDSTENLISGSYKQYYTIYETDPDDSNPWTASKLDSAEFGLVISSLSTTTTV